MRYSSKSGVLAVAALLSGAAVFASACGGSGGDDRSTPASGGSGNAPAAVAGAAGSAAGSAAVVVSACGTGPFPAGDASALDLGTFDDAVPTLTLPKVGNRAGTWFVDFDATTTATFDGAAATGAAKTAFKPTPTGALSTANALNVSGTGFKAWGFALIAALNQSASMLRCPYDASVYGGISFYIKGTAGPKPVHFSIAESATYPAHLGGTCPANDASDPATAPEDVHCFNAHGVDIPVTDTWTQYKYVWTDLAQGNWGDPKAVAAFDPKTLMMVRFTIDGDKDTGKDDFAFSVDQVAFLPTGATGGGAVGGDSGGAGGAGGAGGGSGGGSAGASGGASAGGTSAGGTSAGGTSAGAGGTSAGTGGTGG